jgi:DNA-binding MarR family transcriptional regulator
VVTDDQHDSLGAWAKRYYFASRAMIEAALRPYDLGSTQWYVLYQLANDGPTIQRDLAQLLHLERATLSAVVSSLVGKGLIDQVPDAKDQRQRVLQLTPAGADLWERLPDPLGTSRSLSANSADAADIATAIRVLQAATESLDDYLGNQ